MDSTNRRHDVIRFSAPKGTRDQYRQIAQLAGLPLRRWYREALRKVALEVLENHGVEMDLLPIHPPKPERLQPRIEVKAHEDAAPLEDEDES